MKKFAINVFATAVMLGLTTGPVLAAIVVTPDHIVTGASQVVGELIAIDVPYTTVSPTFGGPAWTTGGGITAHTVDQGFTAPAGPNDGIREPDSSNNVWEPDGTPFSEAKGFFTYGNGPAPGVTWNFNLADSGIDIADGGLILGVYAAWSTRGSDGLRYQFTEGGDSRTINVSQNVLPANNLVLSWTDSGSTVRNTNFQRIFDGRFDLIEVEGGDGFQVWGTDQVGNAGHLDALVIDYLAPGIAFIPEPSSAMLLLWGTALVYRIVRRRGPAAA